MAVSPLAVDPSLRSPTQQPETSTIGGTGGAGSSSSARGENVSEREQETWLENMRTVEFLRQLVKERLERGEFEPDVYGSANGGVHQQHQHQHSHQQHQQHIHAQQQRQQQQQQQQHHQEHPEEQRRELSEAERDAQSLYPVLRAVEGSD